MCTFKHALCNKHSSISRSDRKKLLLQKNYKETNMACYHFAELVYRQAEKYGNRTAIKYRDEATGKWLKVSWNEFAEQITLTAEAMADCGMQVQENIGVYSQNMPQCLYTYFGAYANRIVDIPMYATSSPHKSHLSLRMRKSILCLSESNSNTTMHTSSKNNYPTS